MFSIGNYKVRFNHTSRNFLVLNGNGLQAVCGITTCKILDSETNELKLGATVICENGDNNSKNNRRKRTLAVILQQLFPTDIDDSRKSELNKRARTLFWDAYAEKRGGLEDQLSKENLNVVS